MLLALNHAAGFLGKVESEVEGRPQGVDPLCVVQVEEHPHRISGKGTDPKLGKRKSHERMVHLATVRMRIAQMARRAGDCCSEQALFMDLQRGAKVGGARRGKANALNLERVR